MTAPAEVYVGHAPVCHLDNRRLFGATLPLDVAGEATEEFIAPNARTRGAAQRAAENFAVEGGAVAS